MTSSRITAGRDRANGVQQFRGPALFQHVTRGAGAHQLLHVTVVGMAGERQDPRRWAAFH